MSKRRKATGRTGTRPFLGLPKEMLGSTAFATMSPHACKLLLALAAGYRGNNNGSLALPYSVAREVFGFTHKETYYRALHELQERGFLEITKPAVRRGVQSSTRFAITWESIHEPADAVGHDAIPTTTASNCWKKWRPVHGSDSELKKKESEDRIRNSTGTDSELKSATIANTRFGSGTHKPDLGDVRGPDPELVLRSTMEFDLDPALHEVTCTPVHPPVLHNASALPIQSGLVPRLAHGSMAFHRGVL